MDTKELYESLHQRNQVVQDAIKDVVYDAACHYHLAKHQEQLEARLRQVSQEVTEAARRLKESEH